MTAIKGSGESGVIRATGPQKPVPRALRVPEACRATSGLSESARSEAVRDEPPPYDPTQPATAPGKKLPMSWIMGALLLLGGTGGFVAWQMTHTPATAPAAEIPAVTRPAPARVNPTPLFESAPVIQPQVAPVDSTEQPAVPLEQESTTPSPWDQMLTPSDEATETPTPEATGVFAPAGNDAPAADWAALLQGQ